MGGEPMDPRRQPPSNTIREFISRPPTEPPGPEGKAHHWIVTAVYDVTDDALGANFRNPKANPLILDRESLHFIDAGCWDCEKTYAEAKGTPCSAPPAEELAIDKWHVTNLGYTERLDRR